MAHINGFNGNRVSIEGLDRAEVLAALYNAARPHGGGLLCYNSAPMTTVQASALIGSEGHNFVFKNGRALCVNVSENMLSSSQYESYNGKGTVSKIIDEIRAGKGPNSSFIVEMHRKGIQEAGVLVVVADGISGVHIWKQFKLRFPQFFNGAGSHNTEPE